MSKKKQKVIKLEKEDFTPENIRKAYMAVMRRRVRAAVLDTIYEMVWGNQPEKETKDESSNIKE